RHPAEGARDREDAEARAMGLVGESGWESGAEGALADGIHGRRPWGAVRVSGGWGSVRADASARSRALGSRQQAHERVARERPYASGWTRARRERQADRQ